MHSWATWLAIIAATAACAIGVVWFARLRSRIGARGAPGPTPEEARVKMEAERTRQTYSEESAKTKESIRRMTNGEVIRLLNRKRSGPDN